MATQQFNTNVDVNGEVKGTSLDINGDADISGDLAGLDNVTSTNFIIGGHTIDDVDLAGEFVDSSNHLITSAAANDRFAQINANTTGSSASCTGNASTATTLEEPRAINGVDFDGSAAITITAAATTLTGTSLKSTVVGSSLTSVGAINSGSWRGSAIVGAYIANDTINSQHYADGSIDTAHIADDQVTFAKAQGVTPNVYDNIIKLLPSDFVANDDAGVSKVGIAYKAVAGSSYGMKPNATTTELWALVSIPQGMKATHVDIYDKYDKGVIVYEAQINATTLTSKGTGNCNTQIDITDVNATEFNFLAIEVTTTATSDRVYGGSVTIAAI